MTSVFLVNSDDEAGQNLRVGEVSRPVVSPSAASDHQLVVGWHPTSSWGVVGHLPHF